ncbi:MAG: hypothetical protein AAF492_33245, partial [Verrucomicrobiota bacterium]
VRRFEFSPEGDRIISLSTDRSLKLWDVETGRELLGVSTADADPGQIDRFYRDILHGRQEAGSRAFAQDLNRVLRQSHTRNAEVRKAGEKLVDTALELLKYADTGYAFPARALDLLDRVKGPKATEPQYWRTRGLTLMGLERWSEASDAFDMALERHSKDLRYLEFFGKATASFMLGHREEGRTWYQRGLEDYKKLRRTGSYVNRVKMDAELAGMSAEERKAIQDPELLNWRAVQKVIEGNWAAADEDYTRIYPEGKIPPFIWPQSAWWTIGPYPPDLDAPQPPEQHLKPTESLHDGSGVGPAGWWPITWRTPYSFTFGQSKGQCFYALKKIWVSRDCR